jgi:type I restriction enzyme S subunit
VLQKYSTNFKKQAKIITLKHLDIKIVKNTSIPLPPLSEQEKIADILSTLDEKIEIERKRREKLERIKKSLMDLLLTGKIRVRIEECDNDGRENK